MRKQYVNPASVEVFVPDPDDSRNMPIYEGRAGQAYRHLVSGQYAATIIDPYTDDAVEVTLHVYQSENGGNSSVYNLPDRLREYPWTQDFAERIAAVLIDLYGFDASTETGGQTGVTFTVGIAKFTIGESMTGPGHTDFYVQDLSDVADDGFAAVFTLKNIDNEDISYRGTWSVYETARTMCNESVRAFARFAEKRAAHVDHQH